MVTGFPVWQCILFMGGFTTFYTTLAGMRAVIWTDVIQFCSVMLGIGLIICTALARIPGSLHAAYVSAQAGGRLHYLNLSTDPKEMTSLWACLLGGLVVCMAPLTTDQAIIQRLLTTRSERDCRQSLTLQAFIVIPVTILLSLAGTALYAFYEAHPTRLEGLTATDAVMPFFALHELPAGLSGLMIASIFAASMSVMSAGINSPTTASTVDVYQRLFRRDESPQHYASVGRAGTVLWGAAATRLALSAERLGELAISYNRASSYVSGPLLGVFLLAMLSRRATASGALLGAAIGLTSAWLVALKTSWSFFYLGPIGVAVTAIAGYSLSCLMKQPMDERSKISSSARQGGRI